VTAGKLGWNRAVVSQEIAAAQQRWQMQRYRVISDVRVADRNQGNIVRARAELSAAHEELQRVELMLHRRLAVVFQEYENAWATVSRYREEILPAKP
jgi:hypothetical protein